MGDHLSNKYCKQPGACVLYLSKNLVTINNSLGLRSTQTENTVSTRPPKFINDEPVQYLHVLVWFDFFI